MPEPQTVSWVNVVLPLATLVIGLIAKPITDWLDSRRICERERAARREMHRTQRLERVNTFQRTTLLELQEEMIKLVRTTSQGYTADLKVYRETKKWRAQRLDDDLSEANRLAHARVTLLAVRVRDAKARALVNNLSSTASQLGTCQTYAESGDLLLRQLDDEVEANE